MNFILKNIFITLTFLLFAIGSHSQTIEHGVVKEYCGTKAKQPLPGVEVMVKGAPTSVSDKNGSFALRFATLVAGDKVDYSEIYKDGYVIFNKDALDAWRISNSEKPFTIVMCKESDFRALKKKFYGIIEKSYKAEYEKQKAIAEQSISNELELNTKLSQLKKEYNEKLGNINTYVELFSRIDRNEMDSVEARALEFMEAGEIDKAIQKYEELHIEKKLKEQFLKWDTAENMRKAAEVMEAETQSDMILLVGKMQKQISLYRMGGYEYNAKRAEMTDNLISLLYRLRKVTGDQYNETLGELIVERAETKNPNEQLICHKNAAKLPSVAGLIKLAGDYESFRLNERTSDTIRQCYNHAIELITKGKGGNDSILSVAKERMNKIPSGFYQDPDGNSYAYIICGKDSAMLCSAGPYYSVHLEGDVSLPDEISTDHSKYKVVGIGKFAFGKNYRLKKITLPKYCGFIGPDAFLDCDSLSKIVVNSSLDSIVNDINPSFPVRTELVFSDVPENTDWIMKRLEYVLGLKDPALDVVPLIKAITDWAEKNNDIELLASGSRWLTYHYLENDDFKNAMLNAARCKKAVGFYSHYLLADCYKAKGDYDNAIKEGKKSLNDNHSYTYNHLAYLYMDDKWTHKDFLNAHRCADKAISLATTPEEQANYTDSKGEIYLKEGNIVKAKEYLEKALRLHPTYYKEANSTLHRYFNPDYKPDLEDNNKQQYDRQLRERNIAVALIAFEYTSPVFPKLEGLDMDSIRHEVLGAMSGKEYIDNPIAIESVFKETVIKIGQHLYSFSKYKKIPFKSEWIKMIDADNSHGMASESEYILSLIGIKEIAKRLPCVNFLPTDTERLNVLGGAIKRYGESIAPQKQSIFNDIMDGLSMTSLIEIYKLQPDSLKNFIKEVSENINNFIEIKVSTEYNEPNLDPDYAGRYNADITAVIEQVDENQRIRRKYFYSFVEIAKKAAKLESLYVPERENFIGVPYEELLSIGIIAAQVLMKNKTADQLKRYNISYIATALRWAMRNELKIRYPWYFLMAESDITSNLDYETEKKYHDENIDHRKTSVRIALYRTMIELSKFDVNKIPNKLDFESELEYENQYIEANNSELEATVTAVREASLELDGDMKSCCDYLLSNDFERKKFENLFPVKVIFDTLNYIQQKINEKGYKGY